LGLLTVSVAGLGLILSALLLSGALVFSPEFNIVLVEGPWGQLGLIVLLLCLAVGAGICLHMVWSAVDWRTYLPLLLYIGSVVGLLSIHQLLTPQNPEDLESLYVYSYNLWSPSLLVWLGVCIAASGLAVLRQPRRWTPRQGAVLFALLALALTVRGLLYSGDSEFSANLYSLYSLDTNSIFILIAFVLLLIAAAIGYYSDWQTDPKRWETRARLPAVKAVLVGLVLALSLVDLVYFSGTRPYLALIGFLISWILIAELTSGKPLGSCYKRVMETISASHKQKNLTSRLAKLLSFSSPGMALVKMLIGLILLIVVAEIPNAGKTLIEPFRILGVPAQSGLGPPQSGTPGVLPPPGDLGQILSDDVLASIASIRRQLLPAFIGPGFAFSSAIGPEGGFDTAITPNDNLEIAGWKIPLSVLLAPIRTPMRMLLHVRVIDGEIHGDRHGYTVSAHSTTGEVWSDVVPSNGPSVNDPSNVWKRLGLPGTNDPSNVIGPSGYMEKLVRKLAFKIENSDPALIPRMTNSWEAFDDFETGYTEWTKFHAQGYQAAHSLDNALKGFQDATQEDPQYAFAFYWLGVVLQDEGQPAAAAAALRKSLTLNPELVESKMALGAVLTSFDTYYYDYRPPNPSRPGSPDGLRLREARKLWSQVVHASTRRVSLHDRASANYYLCTNEARSVFRFNKNNEVANHLKAPLHYFVPYFYCKRSEALYKRLGSVPNPDPQFTKEESLMLNYLGQILEEEGAIGRSWQKVVSWPCNAYRILEIKSHPPETTFWPACCSAPHSKGHPWTAWRLAPVSPYTPAALRYFDAAVNLTPYDPVPACNAAEANLSLNHAEAMEALEEQASAHVNLADEAKEIARNESESAQPSTEDVESYYGLALYEYDQAVKREPAQIDARLGYVQTFWEWKNYGSDKRHGEGPGLGWFPDGDVAQRAEDYGQLAVVLTANKRDNTEVANAQWAYGKALLAHQRLPQASKELARATELVPDHPWFHEMRWDLAEAYLCESVRDSPTRQERTPPNLIAEASHILDKIRNDDEKREGPFPDKFLDPENRLEVCQPIPGDAQTRVR
jgi:tetratricopeptide (TPR) repeat protein